MQDKRALLSGGPSHNNLPMVTVAGTVYEGRCRGLRVAIKVLNDQKMDAKSLRKFKDEVELMAYVP